MHRLTSHRYTFVHCWTVHRVTSQDIHLFIAGQCTGLQVIDTHLFIVGQYTGLQIKIYLCSLLDSTQANKS